MTPARMRGDWGHLCTGLHSDDPVAQCSTFALLMLSVFLHVLVDAAQAARFQDGPAVLVSAMLSNGGALCLGSLLTGQPLCRFKDNPLVTGPPSIRFYAGAPLVTSNGMRLGSLCVIDVKPRSLDAEQLMVLANFAEVVVREIEKDIARVRSKLPHSLIEVSCTITRRCTPHIARCGYTHSQGMPPAPTLPDPGICVIFMCDISHFYKCNCVTLVKL